MSIVNAAEHAASPAHLDTSTGLDNRKLAFWTFIGSECLLFGSLIATYLAYKGHSLEGPYPHAGQPTLNHGLAEHGILAVGITTWSTFVLLMSSVIMVLALAAVQRGDKKWAVIWLWGVAFFGAIFLGFQAYEFNHFYHEGLTLEKNLFGSSFFLLTGFHGAHVLVGCIYLSTLAIRAMQGKLGPEKSMNVEIAGLYWHFVDVIWIVIFALVYLIK